MLYRVWDKGNNCYTKKDLVLDRDGDIWEPCESWIGGAGYYPVFDYKNYEVEFNTGITLADGTETFFGDIVKVTDSNWGYGGEYDKTHDSYQYIVITKESFFDVINYWLCDGNVWHDELKLVGNIHETELTDAMKVWIKE